MAGRNDASFGKVRAGSKDQAVRGLVPFVLFVDDVPKSAARVKAEPGSSRMRRS